MISTGIDKKALKLLFSAYWSPSGWKRERDISPSDLEYAKKAGLMFDPVHISHDEAVERAIRSRDSISKERIVSFFLASLTTRRLDIRSALGSFAVAQKFPIHKYPPSCSGRCCPICGAYESFGKPEDLSLLNFERFKWGGVRHDKPLYISFDLEEVAKQSPLEPTPADIRTMRAVLEVARSVPAESRLSHLEKTLASILPSNTSERRTLIGILGYCGILIDPSKASFLDGFPEFNSREVTPWFKDDWPYPVCWWRGSFGVAENAVAYWFPSL
jgi:hypothetical protein